MRHATARAMERLRWPKGAREVQYIFPVVRLACGAEYDRKQTREGMNLFRAEDAYALLHKSKTSEIQREFGNHHTEPPHTKKREWALPDCATCAMELDWALQNPYVIHATKGAFMHPPENALMPIRRHTPQQILDAQTRTCVGHCGAPLLTNTPVFGYIEMQRITNHGLIPWAPTCETCHTAVLEHFGTIAKAKVTPPAMPTATRLSHFRKDWASRQHTPELFDDVDR